MSLAPREGQEDLFTLMMAQIIKYKPTVISRESTSAVLVTLSQLWSCKLASPPAVTPGHCQHRSVSLIMVTAREAANTPTGATAGPHEPPAQRQNLRSRRFLLHQCSRFFAQVNAQNERRTSSTRSVSVELDATRNDSLWNESRRPPSWRLRQ